MFLLFDYCVLFFYLFIHSNCSVTTNLQHDFTFGNIILFNRNCSEQKKKRNETKQVSSFIDVHIFSVKVSWQKKNSGSDRKTACALSVVTVSSLHLAISLSLFYLFVLDLSLIRCQPVPFISSWYKFIFWLG